MQNQLKGKLKNKFYKKFEVNRTDGSDKPGGKHHGCKYFVIDIDHDPYAESALLAYAKSCEKKLPGLASAIRKIPWFTHG